MSRPSHPLKPTPSARIGAATAGLLLLTCTAMASAQDRFAETPDLVDRGVVDGWRVGKLDSDDVWLGRACVLYKDLSAGPNPVNVALRFEPDDEETMVSFAVPQAESVPDPDEVDWGYLEPTDFIYALNGTEIHETPGHIGWEYIDAKTVYVSFSFDIEAAAVDRLAASDWVGLAATDGTDGMRFNTGQSTRAVAWARQCLAEFD